MQKIKFPKCNTSFHAKVRDRADAYFTENKISKNADGAMVIKTIFFLSGTLSLYLLILFSGFSPVVLWCMAGILGMFSAFVGFNVGHDAIHGSYSSNQTVNKLLGSVFYLIGANPYVWSISHNLVHHTYTNIPEHDEDLIVAPGLIRVSPHDKYTPIMKFQQYYSFLLYGFAGLSWVFRKDFVKFFQDYIGGHDNSDRPKKEVFNLFFFKGLYYVLTIVVPLLVIDNITWWQFIIGYLTLQVMKGFVLGLVFQLAHIVEGLDFPEPDENGLMEDAWAELQLRTTANFGRKDFLTTFLCGGLNMQVEHHLFPKVCHTHYQALSDIVKETALEYGIPYHENSSFWTASASHFRILKRLGAKRVIATNTFRIREHLKVAVLA